MKRLISAIAFLLTLALLPLESSTAAASAKTTMITSLPLTGIIDIFDRGNADHFYALHSDGTIWIGNGSKPAVRGPQIPGAVEISGNLILTSAGEVWSWDEPKFAIEGAKAIKASTQYILILMADGKTIKAYGNTANVTYSMYEYVSNEPIVDFDGYDKDYMGMSTMFTAIPDEFSKFKGNYVQISQGYGGSYKLLLHKDGTVWGNTIWNDDPIKRITPLKDIIEVAAVALNSGTALDKYGKVWTWGDRINIPLLDTTEKIQTKVNAIPLQKQISLRINGKFIASDPGPIQTNGTTFVPIRSLFESIGAKIGYNNDNITVSYRKQLLAFKVYDTKATLDGKSVVMPAASLSYQGRTYVPLRFLAQAFGAKVQWNNNIDGVDVQFPAAG
ncbi:stalk domain-containing protein [Paenibacillus sp. MCAF20]